MTFDQGTSALFYEDVLGSSVLNHVASLQPDSGFDITRDLIFT
jgi:hypothetical protein